MEIILLEQVRKLGKVGEVVKVKNGYARNYLIPNKKALRATKDNITYFETQKKEIEQKNAEKLKAAEKTRDAINEKIAPVIMQAGEDGRLYGSVSASEIADSLNTVSKESITHKQVEMNRPIKFIGIHEVDIDIFGEVTAKIYVNVSRSASEAKEAEEKFKKGEIGVGAELTTQEKEQQLIEAKVEEIEDPLAKQRAEEAEKAQAEEPAEAGKSEESASDEKKEDEAA